MKTTAPTLGHGRSARAPKSPHCGLVSLSELVMAARHSGDRGSPHETGDVSPRAGFTLLELVLVIFVIGLVSAVTIPQVIPLILFSQLEGSARHLAGWGRATISHATMMRRELTLHFDLDQQQYWAVELKYPEEDALAGEGEDGLPDEDQIELFEEIRRDNDLSPEELSEKLSSGELSQFSEKFDAEKLDAQFGDRFARFAKKATLQRAKNVKHEGGILDDVGGLFDEDDGFSLEPEDEPEAVELTDPVLERSALPEGVRIDSMSIGEEGFSSGEVELPLGPLGLMHEVRFYLASDDDEWFTVVWDPLTGTTNVYDGWEDAA